MQVHLSTIYNKIIHSLSFTKLGVWNCKLTEVKCANGLT